MALQCSPSSSANSRHSVFLQVDDPAAPANQYLGDEFTFEVGPTAAGPWAPAAISSGVNSDCVGDTSGNPVGMGGSAAGIAGSVQVVALASGTQHFFRITHVSSPFAGNPTGQVLICDVTTLANPVITGCVLGGPPTQTTYPGRIGTASGFVNTSPGCDADTVQWEISTVSGGPYTPDGPANVANLGSPSHNFTGLTPNTTYFYRNRLSNPTDGPDFVTSAECSFTTLALAVAITCSPATAVTDSTATLNGSADNVPTNEFVRFSIGTTPGGPYPNPTSNQAGTNVSGQAFSAPVVGLLPSTNYFFVAEHMAADGTTVLDSSSECSFTTSAAPPAASANCNPATGVTQTGATLNGTGVNVPVNQFVRLAWGTTLGGPYSNTTPNVAGTNAAAQAFSAPIAGLTASTPYYFVAQYLDTDGTTVLSSSVECSFTTLANVVPPNPPEPAACDGAYGARPNAVDAPVVLPYGYGALSAYNIIDSTDPHDFNGISYKSPACQAGVAEWVDSCESGSVVPKPATDGDRNAIVRGCPFHLITNLSCKTTTLEAMHDEALTIFRLGEQRAVEAAVFTRLLVQPDVTVISAVQGISFLQGLAILESAVAECYPGRATIHGDRGVGVYAARNENFEKAGAGAYTALGSKWALYAGSPNVGPDGVAAPDGHTWLWATSDVTLRRSEIDVRPQGTDHILKIGTNVPQVIVERSYVPSRECCAFAFLICLGC